MAKQKFNTYKECIPYLFNLERAGIKYDLRNIKTLLKYLGNPQNNFKSIHVAGTNGKGSVSSIINSFLIEREFKTGLYTSPHIRDFRERILVDGKLVSKRFIISILNILYEEIERIKPSFFEATTAIAFEYFKHMKVAFAVIETGLGGRLDSTNVIKPVLSVITSVSIDHVEFLGNKIQRISKEKGGIIKKNIPVIVGKVDKVSAGIFRKIAREKSSEIIFSEKKISIKITKKNETGFYFDIEKKLRRFFFPIVGDYQSTNIATSLAAINILSAIAGFKLHSMDIRNTFANLLLNSNLYGRFQLIHSKPKIIIDVSHNLQAIENIKSNLEYFKFSDIIIIFAMMKDKDYKKCAETIGKIKARIILTKPNYKRAVRPYEIYNSLRKNKSRFIVKENLTDAFKYAFEISEKKDLILITGSFFLVSDFLEFFESVSKGTPPASDSGRSKGKKL